MSSGQFFTVAYWGNERISAEEVQAHCQPGELFEDTLFPLASSHNGQPIWWKRPPEIAERPFLFGDSFQSPIVQGAVSNCYFLGALSLLARHFRMLKALFVTAYPQLGFYQIKFYKGNSWLLVTIDDRIPVANNGKPVFGKCQDENELWVCLLEKAYAKLHGSYAAIATGSIESTLIDLTGEASMNWRIHEPAFNYTQGAFWELMNLRTKEQAVIGCYSFGKDKQKETYGILHGHAYLVLECLMHNNEMCLRVHNPWIAKKWTGKYSASSSFEFLMTLSEFWHVFDGVFLCRMFKSNAAYHNYLIDGMWDMNTAGGCTNSPNWKLNTQFLCVVNQPTEVFITLSQPCQRLQQQAPPNYTIGIGYSIFRLKNDVYTLNFPDGNLVEHSVAYSFTREVSSIVSLPTGRYLIVPTTYEENEYSAYFLALQANAPLKCTVATEPLPQRCIRFGGQWRGPTAGGCLNYDTWKNNIFFKLEKPTNNLNPIQLVVYLTQCNTEPYFYIGLQIFSNFSAEKGIHTAPLFNSLPCANSKEVRMQLSLPLEGFPYVIMPVTFEPNEETDYELKIFTESTDLQASSSVPQEQVKFLDPIPIQSIPIYIPQSSKTPINRPAAPAPSRPAGPPTGVPVSSTTGPPKPRAAASSNDLISPRNEPPALRQAPSQTGILSPRQNPINRPPQPQNPSQTPTIPPLPTVIAPSFTSYAPLSPKSLSPTSASAVLPHRAPGNGPISPRPTFQPLSPRSQQPQQQQQFQAPHSISPRPPITNAASRSFLPPQPQVQHPHQIQAPPMGKPAPCTVQTLPQFEDADFGFDDGWDIGL